MKSIVDFICLPLAIVAAVNYGLVGIFGFDLLSLMPTALAARIVQIIVGLAGLGLATGLYGRR
ncbi:MAG: DUF378 domain-containing protein [Rickettsiales bacterium]|jgi:uncharacterized membrane protein YuzA (DUF378 family)|nr:DUF378 domain-containing protein [Rickettsiales bacterium]